MQCRHPLQTLSAPAASVIGAGSEAVVSKDGPTVGAVCALRACRKRMFDVMPDLNPSRRAALRRALGACALAALAGCTTVVHAPPPPPRPVPQELPPPPPQPERPPPPPAVGMHWVPGHWVWGPGRWMWVPGRYVAVAVPPMPAPIVEPMPVAPAPGYVFVRGHWRWTGSGWVWVRGAWVLR